MIRTVVAAVALLVLGMAASPVSAQSTPKVFTGENYAITFTTAWDTIINRQIIRKDRGIGGMATMAATASNSLPDIDSLSAAYADMLGGEIKKDSSGVKAIGKYTVHWQKFTYDSLPTLSKTISDAAQTKVDLRNGSFRVYYLNSEGFTFSIATMAIIQIFFAPYPDVEAAIATLKLGAQAGIVPLSSGFTRDIWVLNGKLGGAWLKSHRVFAVECYDVRGSLLGHATHAAEGAWNLPRTGSEMLVRLRTAQGEGMHFLVRP